MRAIVALLFLISQAMSEPVVFVSPKVPAGGGGTSGDKGNFGKWVDDDDPSLFGDYETVNWDHYYHGCENIPCDEPPVMKVDLADKFKQAHPRATVKEVLDCQVFNKTRDNDPVTGFKCHNYLQGKSPCRNRQAECTRLGLGIKCERCADYKVAFFCETSKVKKVCKPKGNTPWKRNFMDVLAKLVGKEKVERVEHGVYERHLHEEALKDRKRTQKETQVKELLELLGKAAKDEIEANIADRGLTKETEAEKNTQGRALEAKLLLRLLENEKMERIKQEEAKRRLMEEKKREKEIKQRETEDNEKQALLDLLADLTN